MNGVRLYFETKDVLGNIVKCYGDYIKRDNDVIITDWAMLEEVNGKIKRSQPFFIYPIVESKKNEIIFPTYEGCFNEFTTVKNEMK